MINLLINLSALALAFVGGAVVGIHNTPTVEKAIAAVKAAEASAAATLAKISAHKAS